MTQANDIICEYIYFNWIAPHKSQRAFGLDNNIEESTVRKIKNSALKIEGKNYNIPVKTVQRICDARGIKLSDFFVLLGL